MHTFTPYMLMKDNFGAEFLICDKLRANAQTLSGSSPAQNKKEPLLQRSKPSVRGIELQTAQNKKEPLLRLFLFGARDGT